VSGEVVVLARDAAVDSALAAEDDARGAAARAFRRRLAPLLDFAAEPGRFPGLTDLFVDGDRITVAEGETLHGFTFADFPGLSPPHVRGAMHNASVYKDTPFGSRKPYFSVRMPPTPGTCRSGSCAPAS
jgi:hypothetical protein